MAAVVADQKHAERRPGRGAVGSLREAVALHELTGDFGPASFRLDHESPSGLRRIGDVGAAGGHADDLPLDGNRSEQAAEALVDVVLDRFSGHVPGDPSALAGAGPRWAVRSPYRPDRPPNRS